MLRTLLIILALALAALTALPAQAEEVLVLLSLRSQGYREVVAAARQNCRSSYREIYLSETPEVDLPRLVRETRSKVVLAVGDKAFRLASSALPRTPLVGVLTLEAHAASESMKTISYLAQPEQYFQVMKQLGRRRVGVLYGAQMSAYIRRAESVAGKSGVSLVKREVGGHQELAEALASIRGQVDALWVLPDSAVVAPGTVDMLFRFTSETNIPAVVFSKNYLNAGAAVALEPERTIMGKQAGELLCHSLGINHADPAGKSFSLHSNPTILRRLGIPSP